jgi:phospho-N-acetylmuramoyl-pentapeptide-transferase
MILELIDGFFGLITFRASLAAIISFLICIILGPKIIAFLRSRKVGERAEKGDSTRLDRILSKKNGIPTMGGIFMIASILLSISLLGNLSNPALWVLLFTLTALCLLGAYDDYLKLTGKIRKGIPLRHKLWLQLLVGLTAGFMLTFIMLKRDPDVATTIFVPIFSGLKIDLGVLFPVFVAFVIVACSNAVNITDGLDGLAAGCLAIATLAYTIIAYVAGRVDWTGYLEIPYVSTSAEFAVCGAAILGACMGFLWFNCHPAQIFMGDSGSLALGGSLGLIACITKQELLIFLVGGIFVIEVLSSLLQIVYFRLFGRRILSIAPLHHHFQFQEIPETKITQRFWIIAIILAVASLATLKLRY